MKWPGYMAWMRERFAAYQPKPCYFCNFLTHAKKCPDCDMPTSCASCEAATGGLCSKHYRELGHRETDTIREAR